MTKRKKRDTEKYPALKKELNLKTRQDEIEIDYFNKLNDEEKEFLNKFNEEYVNATLDRKDFNNNIENTKEWKQACDLRSNERKRCLYTRSKASGNLSSIEDYRTRLRIENYEDILIEKMDNGEDLDDY